MKKILFVTLIGVIFTFASSAFYAAAPSPSVSPEASQSPSPVPMLTPAPSPSPEPKALIIQTKDYSFKVSEPWNWRGFSEDAAKYYVDVYFCLDKYTFKDSPATMFAVSKKKSGYSVKQHLTWDMDDLKNRNDSIQFTEFRMGDISYDFATKIYQTDPKNATYLCYIDPDQYCPFYLIFTLKGPKEICDKNKEAFIFLLQSFWWMGTNS